MKKLSRRAALRPPSSTRLASTLDRSLVIKLYALALTDVVTSRPSGAARTGPKTRD